MESSIEIRNVSKSFGGPLVLRNVSVTLSPGKVLGLVGENGSGKSTLIKILSGYHYPEPGGEVIVAGAPMPFGSPAASRSAGLRFVHQNLGHVLAMSAVENMGLGSGYASRRWINWKTEAKRTRDALAQLHIEMDVEKPLSQARAVERAAVAIARAIKPEKDNEIHMLVLDEPTASLPPAEVETLFNIIRRSAQRGMAIMYVSHRLDEVEEITDEVAVLRDGNLIGGHKLREIGRSKLISMMIGRDLQTVEEASQHVGATKVVDVVKRPVVFEVRDLRSTRLDGTSFIAHASEIVGVAGIDGSGREELARALVGAIDSTGDVRVNGNRVPRSSPRKSARAGLALLPGITELGSSVSEFTVMENLTLATLPAVSRRVGLKLGEERDVARDWIERVDVRPRDPRARFTALSGGNRQKVIFAKWLARKSPVYVLDEPTAGVDVGARENLRHLVVEEAALGTTFIVCSSDLDDLETMCHRILILKDGVVAAEVAGSDITRANLLELLSGAMWSRGSVYTENDQLGTETPQ